jgi:predicted SprT family Zn-dependent metalloprotease
MNAALCFIPGEIHVALQSPMLRSLSDTELRVLLGHEFSHYKLYRDLRGPRGLLSNWRRGSGDSLSS